MNIELKAYNVQKFEFMNKVYDYLALIKLRLSLLVVFSSLMGYMYACGAVVDWLVLISLVTGGGLVTAGSNAFNQVYEKDIDAQMKRTKNRPIPSGRMSEKEGLIAAFIMSILGIIVLYRFVNIACAVMGGLSLLSYVLAYTPLKRISHIATLVGALPGAMPFAIGWFAFKGSYDFEVLVLFLIQFIWQFPHTWSIAWLQKEDYKKVNIKLNPFGESKDKISAYYIMIYAIMLVPTSLMPWFYGFTHGPSALFLIFLGLYLIKKSIDLFIVQSNLNARGVLVGSIIYLPLVQIALVLDKIFVK